MELKVLHSLIESARDVYPDSLPMQALVVSQAILESGFATSKGGSTLALKYMNYFGIKKLKSRPDDIVMMTTREEVKGKVIRVKAPFAVFKDAEDCFKQHKAMMSWTRYLPVSKSKTPIEAFVQIQKCGWATDSSYTTKLVQIYNKYVKEVL